MCSMLRTRWPGLLTAAVLLLGVFAAPLHASSPTPVGTNVTVAENGVTLTFSNVTTAGETTVTPIDPNSLTGAPGGYVVNSQERGAPSPSTPRSPATSITVSTTGYAAGTYLLSFSAGNDPVPHTVQFKVK